MNEQIPQPNAAQLAEIEATCACSNVRKAARAVTQLFDEMLQPTGLRSTQFTLLVAVALLGETSVTQLSRALIMDRTTLARNLKPLESLGLLTIEAGTDRRRQLVRLTERGCQALARALPYWEQAQHQVVTSLGEEQWHALRASLKATMMLAQSF
jgi:DNA-binding MarR family transcriptional regulator